MMNKKQSHVILLLADFLSIGMLWIVFNEYQRINLELINHADIIEFGNRIGFLIVGIGIPLFHFLPIMNHYWPNIQKKYYNLISNLIIVLVVVLLTAGFIGSSWIKLKVENAGYVYCRKASGASALAKVLVYTKDLNICQDLVANKRAELR